MHGYDRFNQGSWLLPNMASSNAIELPGEANPLTSQNLFNALAAAASSTHQQIRIGTQQLQNWEKQDGFYLLLQVHHHYCVLFFFFFTVY